MQAKRFDVVNLQRFTEIGFMQSAALAYAAVALVCLIALCLPFRTVIIPVPTAPSVAVWSGHVVGLPFAHAGTTTKIVLVYLCVYALELFSAVVAVQCLASSTEQRLFAFVAARNDGRFLSRLGVSIWFGVERLTADLADGHRSVCGLVFARANAVTEPKTGFVVFNPTRLLFDVFAAIGALNRHSFHMSIIRSIVLVCNYDCVRKSMQHTSRTPVLVDI